MKRIFLFNFLHQNKVSPNLKCIIIKSENITFIYTYTRDINFLIPFFSFLFSAPPTSIEIQGYQHNSKVEVHENQELTLTCIVSDAKPAAQIQWFRSNIEFKPGKHFRFNRNFYSRATYKSITILKDSWNTS